MSTLNTAVVAGASGYIGQQLVRHFEASAITVRTIGRGPATDAQWSDEDALAAVLDGADLLVNLAGRSVSCRYTKRTADEIFASRVGTTATLGRVLARIDAPPALWVNASTGTIYRDARDHAQDERTGELGSGFSVAVARAWEHELFSAPAPIRKVALRMAIVLGAGGGAINPIINLARAGLGGRMGDGGQMFSWAHVDDVVRAIRHLHTHPEISGPVNVATPYPVTNAELMREVRTAWGRRFGAAQPRLAARARGPGDPHRARTGAEEPLGPSRGAARQRLCLPVSEAARGAGPDRRTDAPRTAAGRPRLGVPADGDHGFDEAVGLADRRGKGRGDVVELETVGDQRRQIEPPGRQQPAADVHAVRGR